MMYDKGLKSLEQKLHDIECIFSEKSDNEIQSDVLGSYTGTGAKDLVPEQDVDDL